MRKPGAGSFDVICSNPPYIPDDQWDELDPNVREYEPPLALRGGSDGMDVIRPLIRDAGVFLRPGGQLVLEIGQDQREETLALTEATGLLVNPEVHKDHEGHWRLLVAEKGLRD